MAQRYSWPDPPEREELVVRLWPMADRFEAVVLEWARDIFVRTRPASRKEQARLPDDPAVFATPGLLDVQINGYWGRDFKDIELGPLGIRDLCWSILLSGTTHFLPTITTDAPEVMAEAMANLDEACRAYPDVAVMVAGIHQEGPWISPADGPRGVHPVEHVTGPDMEVFRLFQKASGNRIRVLTMAPEIAGGIDFIREVTERSVVVCLGHHQADGPTIRQAIEAGARGVTHLGNGCANVMPRHPNPLWEQAANDALFAGVIADGHHLPPATVKVFYRAKPSDKLLLVSDAVSMAGAPPGYYRRGHELLEVTEAGRFGLVDSPTLSGAAVSLSRCLANFTAFVDEGRLPSDYVHHATMIPAMLASLQAVPPQLGKPGMPATFVLWRWDRDTPDLVPQRVVLRGRTVYDHERLPVEVAFGATLEPALCEEVDE